MKEFINFEKLEQIIRSLYTEALSEEEAQKYESVIEEQAYYTAESTVRDMDTYIHRPDTKLIGNFCNIRQDWEVTTEFVESDVKPWGKLSDIVKSVDDGTISEEDLAKFQTWCMDWFFTAFGTYNLKYNFQSLISDLEWEDEQQKEVA